MSKFLYLTKKQLLGLFALGFRMRGRHRDIAR